MAVFAGAFGRLLLSRGINVSDASFMEMPKERGSYNIKKGRGNVNLTKGRFKIKSEADKVIERSLRLRFA